MTLLQPIPSLQPSPSVTEPTQGKPEATLTESRFCCASCANEAAAPAQEAAPTQPITDLISTLAAAEEALAVQRNLLRRRVNSEPLTGALVEVLARFLQEGDARARTARKRYRGVEAALTFHCPSFFGPTSGLDWHRGATAALKLALARGRHESPPPLDDAVDVLSLDELESYAYLRRRTQRTSSKGIR